MSVWMFVSPCAVEGLTTFSGKLVYREKRYHARRIISNTRILRIVCEGKMLMKSTDVAIQTEREFLSKPVSEDQVRDLCQAKRQELDANKQTGTTSKTGTAAVGVTTSGKSGTAGWRIR